MLPQGQQLSSDTRVILQGGDGEGDRPPGSRLNRENGGRIHRAWRTRTSHDSESVEGSSV